MRYYPQRLANDCLLTGLECLLQRPREDLGELSFYDGGYLTYGTVGKVLSTQPRVYGPILRDFTPYLWREKIPMLLGVSLKSRPPGGALHCVFWDGSWAWEPWTQTFMTEDMRELDVAYAILSADDMKYNKEIGTLEWFPYWDEATKRSQTPEAIKARAMAESLGQISWLEVVG